MPTATPTRIEKSTAAIYKLDQNQPGVVEAFVSTTNALDMQGDIIVPGAYSKFIAAFKAGRMDPPAYCVNHDWGRVAGTVLDVEEMMPGDGRLPQDFLQKGWGALWMRYQYVLDSDEGRNAYALKRAGAVRQHSVGFLLDEDESEGKASEFRDGTRYLKRIYPLIETSDVLLGAAPRTHATSIKSLEPDPERKEAMAEGSQARIAEAMEIAEAYEAAMLAPDEVELSGEEEAEDKGGAMPTLTGSEAQHMQPLTDALSAINTLIAQELAEGNPEYDCVVYLAQIAQQLINWAVQESTEYDDPATGDTTPPVATYAAPEEAVESKTDETPAWMLAGYALALIPDASRVPAIDLPTIENGDGFRGLHRVRS